MTEFSKFFSPDSLALIGASNDPSKWGFRILNNIIIGGYQGRVYPVNPTQQEILGKKVYKRLADIPEVPDYAVIVVPPPVIVEAVRDCVKKGIKAAVVITAGFAEVGQKGAALQAEMVAEAKRGGLRFIGPNCFGLVSPYHKLYSQMPPVYPPAGPLAVVSQSGNVGLTIARRAMMLNFGVSRMISTGNEADLHAEDFLEFLGTDDKTKIILSYVEGFKEGRKFFNIAKEVSRKKPIIMIKVGETEAGASAARSHTAALSGADTVFDGACRQAGVLRVHNLNDLMNMGYGFLCNPLPRGRRVAISTFGGGWGVLAADACAKLGLDVVRLPEEVLRELDSFMPAWWSRNNPVDLVAGDVSIQPRVIEVLARCDRVDSIIALGVPFPMIARSPLPPTEEERKKRAQDIIGHFVHFFRQIRETSAKYRKPIIVAAEFVFPLAYAHMEREIRCAIAAENSFCYTMPDEAAMVLSAMVRYSEYLQRSR
ncbi:MAG: CoA-binding protein [Dehalococcoidia bacterium]|nr:CoA-binding protein [Dehalococcoidia bacterium]